MLWDLGLRCAAHIGQHLRFAGLRCLHRLLKLGPSGLQRGDCALVCAFQAAHGTLQQRVANDRV